MRRSSFATILICLAVLSTHCALGQGAVDNLGAAFKNAQSDALKTLNTAYAARAKSIVKSYLMDGNMSQAKAANDWVKRLSDADPAEAANGILPNANSEDPLVSLQTLYLQDHSDALARVDNAFLQQAQALEKRATNSADVDTASAAAELVSRIQAKLGSAATPGSPSGDAEALFAPEKQARWKPQKGTWIWDGAILTGSGDSGIDYATNLNPPFVVQFTMTVISGSRERLEMDQVGIHNVGYQDKFGPDGGDENQFFAFKHNQPYHCVLTVSRKKSDFYVDGNHITQGSGETKKIQKITIHAGDGWSPGSAEMQDFIIIRGTDRVPLP